MPFPSHIATLLDRHGIRPDTRSVLYDLYVAMGSVVLEAFADLADRIQPISTISPEDLSGIRSAVASRYLSRCHPLWLEGKGTSSFWHPRMLEGRASGLTVPLGRLGDRPDRFGSEVDAIGSRAAGEGQTLPSGILLLGKNAHYGGRYETVSFDVMPLRFEEALAASTAEGQQHTAPGSLGETSGTVDSEKGIALIWEIQPNVLKPSGERNRAIRKLYGQHRNWHIATLASALLWLQRERLAIYILRGDALAAAHEVNHAKPVTSTIVQLHDRTVQRVTAAAGLDLLELTSEDRALIESSEVLNTGLRNSLLNDPSASLAWRCSIRADGMTTQLDGEVT